MPKVVVTDYTFSSLEVEQTIVEEAGFDFSCYQCVDVAELMDVCADADAVITQFAPVNDEVVSVMQKAKVIVRYGIGYDNVSCETASQKGIPVCNIPDYCIDEVADHALAFILATTRQVLANNEFVVDGNWGLGVSLEKMQALSDLTVGVIGLGRIGREVTARLLGFKCNVLASDPVISAEEAKTHGCTLMSLDELLATSDIVSLHCPSTPETRGMINQKSLGVMKKGAVLINVGRGDLVDLDALTEALQHGRIGGAALDVFNPEPIAADHPLLGMNNAVVSSHIASCSPKAIKKLRETAARLAVSALRGEPLSGVVNGVHGRDA
ncbi:MAG: C-terminal binding protein [Planctomycetes bacterium]|nr:C-terminal binding protein [Planctomycetota bacterium]